jgi:endoglucanase
MHDHSLSFLKRLLAIPGPSGDEAAAARAWRAEAEPLADAVYADVHGNSYALLNAGEPRVLLAGHIDEIGVMISYIDDSGFLFFDVIGGWDTQVLVGQRVRLLGKQGEVVGVIGKLPIHLIKSDDHSTASKVENLWIDIGASSGDEVRQQVRVGTVGVIDAPLYELPNERIVSRSLDNRIGAFVVLEALRLLHADRPAASMAAVATTYEETGSAGAMIAAFHYAPHVALAVDLTFATDHPESNRRRDGDVRLGGGPVLSRGGANNPLIFERLCMLAEQENIPYAVQITPRRTGTDADQIHTTRSGIASGLVSVPSRYMHTPNEMVALADVEHTAKLVAAFVRSVREEGEFVPA